MRETMSDSPSHPSQKPANSKASYVQWVLTISLMFFVLAAIVYYGYFTYRVNRHRRAGDRMKIAITRLSLNRPDDLTDDQWAYCILWTWNLHGNYGTFSYMPTEDLERIVEEFEAKSEADPSLETIDWLWDEYMRAYPPARYHDHWRPTSPDNRSEFEAGAHGGNPLSHWQESYENMVDER